MFISLCVCVGGGGGGVHDKLSTESGSYSLSFIGLRQQFTTTTTMSQFWYDHAFIGFVFPLLL